MNQRFYSLDVLRGATVAFMILVNFPGDGEAIFEPLEHASWHGLTPTDLVFPFFLFAVGNAMAFVMPRLQAAGDAAFLKKVGTRTLLILAIALFYNWFPFIRWENDHLAFRHWVNPNQPDNGVRILGVLQRIALCYFFASIIIYYFKLRGSIIISVILLFGYWLLCYSLGNPGDPYSMAGYFGLPVDKAILHIPHMYKGEGVPFDPEGLTSTLPAIVQPIIGYWVGHYILQKGKTYEMLSNLFVAGCLLLFAGYCWNLAFPINKKIWTSSFVVCTSGLAILVLCVLMFLIDFKQKRGAWSHFFEVFGKNPLFIYILGGVVYRLQTLIRWQEGIDNNGDPIYITPFSWFYEHICHPLFTNPKLSSLLYAICTVLLYWAVAYWMDRRKIYVRV